jgi:hypothetical protein
MPESGCAAAAHCLRRSACALSLRHGASSAPSLRPSASALSLAPALALRGGQLSRPDYVHSVLLGLLANTVAVHLCTLITGEGGRALIDLIRSRAAPVGGEQRGADQHGAARSSLLRRRVLEPAARHLACLLACFLAYLLTYHLTGFVPMGWVVGSKPRLTIFEAPRPTAGSVK